MSEETNTAEKTKAEEQSPSKESIPYHAEAIEEDESPLNEEEDA